MNDYNGKKCIVRCDRSGVFFGTIAEMEGQMAKIENVRNLWWWEGAASIMQLADEGTKKPDDCKFTVTVSEITVTDVIQVIPCTDKAIANLEAVKPWRM